jgi:hypothetical protein
MYREFGGQDDLEQGDIVDNILFTHIPNISDPRIHDNEGRRLEVNLADPLPAERYILTPVEKSRAIVLSQACDCLSKPYICLGKIIPLLEFDPNYAALVESPRTTLRKQTEYINDLYQRAGAKPDAFYLRQEVDFPKSVVSFLEVNIVPRANTDYLRESRILRLSEEGVLDLQFRIAFYFGRFATTQYYMLTDNEIATLRPAAAQATEVPQE